MGLEQQQNPAQITDAIAQQSAVSVGNKVLNDNAKDGNIKPDGGATNSDYEKSGILSKMELHDDGKYKQGERVANAAPGEAGQAFKDHARPGDGRPGHEEHHEHGKGGHRHLEQKLRHEEFHKLSPEDKAKFKAEMPEAQKFHAEMHAWEKSGKSGPAPTKPDMPEHEKLAASVKADKQAIEAHKRQGI
jgi:hypothetical protein